MNTFHRQAYQSAYQDRSKGQFSTAEKFYDIEQSQKRYQQLLEENIWLKQQIQRSRYQEGPSYDKCQNCSHYQVSNMDHLPQNSQNSDLVLWSMLERNKYLEQKIDKLKGQYEKQSRTINSIRSSQKWKNRFTCSPQTNSCYEDKYLQLLRVRSPFY